MGWDYTHKPKHLTTKEFLLHHSGALSWTNEPAIYTVLDTAIVNLRTFYAAVERVDKATQERQVWAAVFLLDYAPKERHNFGWKSMDETMGPNEAACPERILDLLTPTSNEYALTWRSRCRAKIAERKSRPKLREGVTFELYGKPYTIVAPRKGGFIVRGAPGTVYSVTHHRLRQAAHFKEPA